MHNLLLFIIVIQACTCAGWNMNALFVRDEPKHYDQLLDWPKRDSYYYKSLDGKVKEILVPNDAACAAPLGTIVGNNSLMLQPFYTTRASVTAYIGKNPVDADGEESSFTISSWPIDAQDPEIRKWYASIPRPTQQSVDPALCKAVYAKKRPIFNNTGGCQLRHYMHPSSPRCQSRYLEYICTAASFSEERRERGNAFILPEADHALTLARGIPPEPFLVRTGRAVISMCGTIVTACGYLHATASCMATGNKWHADKFATSCGHLVGITAETPPSPALKCEEGAPYSTAVEEHDRVFVLAQVDDTYVYHIALEILPRLIYHLKFLQKNPDIKILWGCDGKAKEHSTRAGLEAGLQSLRPYLSILDLDQSRLIVHKHVLAKKEAWFPQEGGCQDAVYNTWHILFMRKFFLNKFNLQLSTSSAAAGSELSKSVKLKPVLLLVKRSAKNKFTRNGHDSVRQWADQYSDLIASKLQRALPTYIVKVYSDQNATLMECIPCQIKAFSEASVLVGMHGAGLSNMIYMRPNSAVFEIAPYENDARCLLGGGPFSRAATLLGHDYFMHHPLQSEYKWVTRPQKSSELNATRLVTDVRSFLQSIGKSA
jgi:hypothetical protein